MKKQKNHGITLVALVMTIIILLILAGITISSLTGSGLFENAKLAEQKSKEAQEKEEGILDDYENKIGQYVDGTREEDYITREEYENIMAALNKKTVLLEKKLGEEDKTIVAATWTTLETISLSGYGTGKAIINYSANLPTTATTNFGILIAVNGIDKGIDGSRYPTALTYLAASTSATISYDENTVIRLGAYAENSAVVRQGYSIMIIPD